MSSVALEFITSLVGPVISLKETIQEYRRKQKEKGQLKEDLANAFAAEAKEYEEVNDEMDALGKKFLPIIQKIEGQPTPGQLIEVIDCLSQTPRILAKQLASFIHMARACKDISEQKGFMDSLLRNNRFMYDFIERMGSTYIGKNTVKVDSSFFRFILMYKREILKDAELGKVDKKELDFLEKRMKSIMHGLNEPFLKRHIRMIPIKKWKHNLTILNTTVKDVEIDAEGMDTTVLKDFMPPEIRQLAPFLDKSP